MRIIEIVALDNGAHRNQTTDGVMNIIPDGWAVVPENIVIPDTFPFVNITVDVSDEEGMPFVTEMTAGVVPEPEDVDVEPTEEDDTAAMLVDHEYRLTLLELGIVE